MAKDFSSLYKNICTEEQLYRISMYPPLRKKIEIMSKHEILYKSISFIFQNDHNWIISLSRFLENIVNYADLLENLSVKRLNDELIQLFIEVVSDTSNYFDIKDYSDLVNYEEKKNKICLNILNSKFDSIPENIIINCSKRNRKTFEYLKYMYPDTFNYVQKLIIKYKNNIKKLPDETLQKASLSLEDDLYKFAFLEYKFGISLDDAETLLNRYGSDISELPEGTLKDYLQLLHEIVYCDNIKDVIKYALENDKLKEPWNGFPNARDAEGKILDLFSELYNQTLYKPLPEDKENYMENYIDSGGKQYDIQVYKVKKDFSMNVRVEGTFKISSLLKDGQIDYAQYYNRVIIKSHGNSESYLHNSNIALAESDTSDIIVGYEKIYRNQLAGASPKIQSSFVNDGLSTGYDGNHFSIFGVSNIRLQTPTNMINNTRTTGFGISPTGNRFLLNFNELFKDRIVANENGKEEIYKPSYVVWIENDTEEERKNPEWKKNRENDIRWLHTKQAAAQLGVPIVIIDREYFAKRELKKTELMKKLITNEKIDEKEFGEFLGNYNNLSKPKLIKQLFTKIENNRNGMANRFPSYFSAEYCIEIRTAILDTIYNMNKEEAIECLTSLIDISNKEKDLSQYALSAGIKQPHTFFYINTVKIATELLNNLQKDSISGFTQPTAKTKNNLLMLYLNSNVSADDVHQNFIEQDSTQSAKSMQEGEK